MHRQTSKRGSIYTGKLVKRGSMHREPGNKRSMRRQPSKMDSMHRQTGKEGKHIQATRQKKGSKHR
jgi:hypothetical protein